MNLKLNTLAAALVLGFAAQANAAIDNGAGGNGELFFSIWDANGSYTRSLEMSINVFDAQVANPGSLDLSWTADNVLSSYLASVADTSALKWNVMATDISGARRVLTTYTAPEPAPTATKTNDVIRTAAGNTSTFVNNVNAELLVQGATDSLAVSSASSAWAGKSTFKTDVGGLLNVNNAATVANNSYVTGLGFTRIDAAATGIARSVYNEYVDESSAVKVYLDGDNTLHIAAAVPEPSEYAMILAGLGMIGLVARRRRNGRV